jgi:serine/threonine-protein kinase
MGTPDYMSPEQAQGLNADFRSDIYSLGIVLFEVFTGALPFTGDTMMQVVLGHIRTPPPPPRQLNPRIPERLEAVILKAVEKDPGRRYETVSAMLQDLDEVSTQLGSAAPAA